MQIAVLTFDGFNELDSLIASSILNRLRPKGWQAYITSPTPTVTSMNGVTIHRQQPMSFAETADAVLIGSGIKTREIATDAALLAKIKLDPKRQLIGAQCSGTLLLAKLGLIVDLPACTDLTTKPWVIEAGVNIIDAPFVAHGNVATAGGCLASQYLAAWMIARGTGLNDAEAAIHYVAPVGEKETYVSRAMAVISPFLPAVSSEAQVAETVEVIISGGFANTYNRVLPAFLESSGIKVTTKSGASEGTGPKTIKYQLEHGETADVVILSGEGLQSLFEDGRIVPGTQIGLASSALGVAVCKGAAKPDISTSKTFRQALLNAVQIVAPASTSGKYLKDVILPKLNISNDVTLMLVARGVESTAMLAEGKADLAVGPVSELVDLPGIELVGLLPDDLQLVQVFTAAITKTANNPDGAKRLIDFLTSDQALDAINKTGMTSANREAKQ